MTDHSSMPIVVAQLSLNMKETAMKTIRISVLVVLLAEAAIFEGKGMYCVSQERETEKLNRQ